MVAFLDVPCFISNSSFEEALFSCSVALPAGVSHQMDFSTSTDCSRLGFVDGNEHFRCAEY